MRPRPSLAAAGLAAILTTVPAPAAQDCTLVTSPNPVTVTQPDGGEVELFFRGTGLNHWYEDASGYPVVRTEEGWMLARLAADGTLEAGSARVGEADPAQLGLRRGVVPAPRRRAPGSAPGIAPRKTAGTPGGRPGAAFAVPAGSVKNLVLLLRFSDHGPAGQDRALGSSADYDLIMNAVGGDPVLAPTGSVRDHYLENSYGAFSIDSTVVGWLDLPDTETHYANGNSGLTSLTWDVIIAGLEAADPLVDFGDFDEDGDGVIDAITFLHSGYGAEFGGDDQYGTNYVDRMWSHKWSIPTWTSDEGVKVSDYNISAGLWATSGDEAGRIGVVVHELGHFFGIPDLYDTNGDGQGLGNWGVMGAGAWGFDGSQRFPTHMTGWTKMKLGWLSPRRILPGAHLAAQVETNQELLMIDSGYPSGEYLLIENRQNVGFDGVIPQSGLAVWHVDEGKDSFVQNTPNTDEGYPGQAGWPGNDRHYRIALLQADGDYDMERNVNRGDAGDPYHSGGIATVDGGTTPGTDAYQDGTLLATGNALTGIGASGANVAFTYSNPAAPSIVSVSLPDARVDEPYVFGFSSTGGSAPLFWTEHLADPVYTVVDLGPQPFVGGGTPQGFNADEGTWGVDLPFPFPWYDTVHPRVYVTPNGTVDLAPLKNEFHNNTLYMRAFPRIAALWDDLVTDGAPGQDVYLTATADSLRIRFEAETWAGGNPANFAVTLYRDGRIRLDYGGGNTGLTPTVGISRGEGGDCTIVDTHDGQGSLTDASSIELVLNGSQLPPGLVLDEDGTLHGTPTVAGTHAFTVRVTDDGHRYDLATFTLEVEEIGARPGVGPVLKGNPRPASVQVP